MSEQDSDTGFSLVPYGSRELVATETAQDCILAEMVVSSLALARAAAVSAIDLEASQPKRISRLENLRREQQNPSSPMSRMMRQAMLESPNAGGTIDSAVDFDALVVKGKRLQRKEGMTPEDVQAFELFHQAAVGGHAEAQFLMVLCYRDGFGISQCRSDAIEWLHKSAESGFSEAQYQLGLLYFSGGYFPHDYGEAVKWSRKAAEQGHAYAQYNLGHCYEKGQGVPQDHAEAVKWYRMAAEQGNASGQSNLGRCYESGLGVEIDLPRAYGWYQLVAERGRQDDPQWKLEFHEKAREQAAVLAALMSPSEFKAAQQLYEEFKAKYERA